MNPFFPQGEGHILKDVQVGEESVALKDGVHVALVGRHVVDPIAHEDHIALIRCLKAADDAQRCGLAAAGGAEKRQKLIVVDVQIDVVQHDLAIKGLGDVFQLDNFVHACSSPQRKKTHAFSIRLMIRPITGAACRERPGHNGFESLYSKTLLLLLLTISQVVCFGKAPVYSNQLIKFAL